MATIRTLVTRLVLDSRKAFQDLQRYGKEWTLQAKVVEAAATRIEQAAHRVGSAMSTVASGAASVRSMASAPQASRTGGGGARPRKDPLEAAIAGANQKVRRDNVAAARLDGMAAGAAQVTEATRALGSFASASDRARAKVSDLSAQVERNRREMTDLRAQALRTGDADGTLAGRMQGLSVATQRASGELREARGKLRDLEGGFFAAVKGAASLQARVVAVGTALGNLGYDLAKRGLQGIGDALVGSAKAAMDWEKALVDVAKVAKSTDLTKDGLLDPRVSQGIKDVSKDLGVMPTEVAELTAQITAAFSGKTDIVALASDVTKIGVAWDISGKHAGEFFKQTSAGLQINSDETKLLFGSINQLGNELGIKSSEIAEAMTRSAGVIKGANLSGETGAALNATLIKAGASAEVAATGVRTFIARLGAGEAATDKQIHAFNALGLSAEKVAKNLASGDAAKAEAQIQEVVAALVKMGETAPDQRMATLIQLFGSESIGSIGAAATAVDTLAASFAIAGDKAAAATSVQQEYDRVSNTSAARVEKLKANIGVLAIELGEKLLPYVDRVVNFLTSPEGQEWGASAVEKAAAAVTTFAEVVGFVVGALGSASEALGGTTVAVGLLAVAVGALLGPWGLLLTGAVALGQYLGGVLPGQIEAARQAELALAKSLVDGRAAMTDLVTDLRRHDGVFAKVSDGWREMTLRIMGATQALTEFYRRQDAEEVRAGKLAHEEAKRREVDRQREEQAKRTRSVAEADDGRRRAAAGAGTESVDAASIVDAKGRVDLSGFDSQAKERIWDTLVTRRKSLRPSERKMLQALSKDLDRAIPGAASKGRHHKATKMDRQLAAMDPSLRGVLTAGGEEDAGGDAMVHDDVLSKGAFKSAVRGPSALGGISGPSGVGPGPNIHNTIFNNSFSVSQTIDARGQGTAAENIAAAANVMGQEVNRVQWTGVERVLANRNAGGRMA